MSGPATALRHHLESADEIVIATQLRDGGEVPTTIWAVVVDGVGYVRNGFGEASRWYRRAQRTHRAVVVDGDRRHPVRIEDVHDEATLAAVDAAYRAKYAGPGLTAVVSATTRRATMRLIADAD